MTGGGKQHRYCPNCGVHLYDNNLSMNHVKSLMCSDKCRNEWELKYAGMILRKDAPEKSEARITMTTITLQGRTVTAIQAIWDRDHGTQF